jgi:hypothetical protein
MQTKVVQIMDRRTVVSHKQLFHGVDIISVLAESLLTISFPIKSTYSEIIISENKEIDKSLDFKMNTI